MDIYREEIVDHYKNPRNFGELADPKIRIKEGNSSCGDMIVVDLRLSKDGKIEEMRWKGIGCAISTAAASMLSERVVGMAKDEVISFGEKGVVGLLGGEINAGRMKCATLAYRAVISALEKEIK